MSTQSAVAIDKMIFRKTNAHTGRHVAVTPAKQLDAPSFLRPHHFEFVQTQVSFSNGEQESGLSAFQEMAW